MTQIYKINQNQYLDYLNKNVNRQIEQLDLKAPKAPLSCFCIKDGSSLVVSVVSGFYRGSTFRIKGLHTLPSHRGRNYAKKLCQHIMSFSEACLFDTFASQYSHELFLSLGFVDIRTIKHPKGDVYYMRRGEK